MFSMATAVPLTQETVTEAVKEVKWDDLCWCLRVPPSKCQEIRTQSLADNHSRLLVDWWLSTDPAPSWRRLIHQLDCRDTRSANKIRHNAEPVQGTFHKSLSVFEVTQSWVNALQVNKLVETTQN